jgi:hypothetical protein
MGKDDKLGSIDGGMGGMTVKPVKAVSKPLMSPDYTYRSKPSKATEARPEHDPERFNRVLKETENLKERSSVLIDPDLIGRLVIAFLIFMIYMIFFR